MEKKILTSWMIFIPNNRDLEKEKGHYKSRLIKYFQILDHSINSENLRTETKENSNDAKINWRKIMSMVDLQSLPTITRILYQLWVREILGKK